MSVQAPIPNGATDESVTKEIVIEPPFSIEFDINRCDLSSAAEATIRIYNLGIKTRNLLRVDQLTTAASDFRTIELRAGYTRYGTTNSISSPDPSIESNLPIIFSGYIQHGQSVREGNSFVTTLVCHGVPLLDSVSVQYPAGTSQSAMIADIASQMSPGVSLGAIGSYPGKKPRGQSFAGDPMALLNELSNGGAFVDNTTVNVLNVSEVLAGVPTFVIDSSTGLLNTPVVQNQLIMLDLLFEPRIQVGAQVQLNSVTASGGSSSQVQINGPHRVSAVKHRGMISPAVCGDAVTSVTLFPGTFTPVQAAEL